MKTIEILLPVGFMNCGITGDNHLIADTNDSTNWNVISFPLPNGKWRIHSYKNNNTIVVLIKR